jgi:hypothetical protein
LIVPFGALPATFLMFVIALLSPDFEPRYLGILWSTTATLGAVGLWLAVFQNPRESNIRGAVTFTFLIAELIADSPFLYEKVMSFFTVTPQSFSAKDFLDLGKWCSIATFFGPATCASYYCFHYIAARWVRVSANVP